MSEMDCGHDDINQSVLGHCRACDLEWNKPVRKVTVEEMGGTFNGPDSVKWLRDQRGGGR